MCLGYSAIFLRQWSWVWIRVFSGEIRLGNCSKTHILVPSRTRWALSNGAIRFSIDQIIVPKTRNIDIVLLELWIPIRVIPCRIRPETCSNCSIYVPSTTWRALYNGVLRFLIAQRKIFGPIDDVRENVKIIFWLIRNLCIPLYRARRVVLET